MRKPFRESEAFEIMHRYLGVQYVYEEVRSTRETTLSVSTASQSEQNIAAALTALPSDLLSQLEQAANRSYMRQILTLIQNMRQYDPKLAQAFMAFADNFEYEKILTYLQTANKGTSQ